MTARDAMTVVNSMWALRDQALIDRDVSTIAEIETGPALAVDLGKTRYGIAPNRSKPETFRSAYVYVPRQTAVPAYFLAEVLTTASKQPWVEMMIFTRGGAEEPWKLAFDTGYGGALGRAPQQEFPVADDDGYNVVPKPRVDPMHAPLMLADYYQSWKESGAAPAGNLFDALGTWTQQEGRKLSAHLQDSVRDNGLRGHFTFSADPQADGLWQFGVNGTYDLVCSVVRQDVVWTGRNGAHGPHQDRRRASWGPDIVPGTYRRLTAHFVRQVCILDPGEETRGDNTELRVVGADPWIVRNEAQP